MHLRKLYGKMRKRLAKKIIGHPERWRKLENGLKLKPGDLVSSCSGYNQRITEITPRMVYTKTGWAIIDFNLQILGGGGCSLINCCTFPMETREEIIAYFKNWASPQNVAYCEKGGWGFHKDPKVIGVMEGKEVFDENGEPHYEYCNIWERKARFPDRLREEMARDLPSEFRGRAINYEEAYVEGWASFIHAWPDETNSYKEFSRLWWGFSDGRRHANEVTHDRADNSP